MTKRYGIDLGTTYSTISRYDESRSEVKALPLESEDGETSSLRSVIYYPPEGSPVVGEVAWNTRKQDPERVVVGIKRRMGDDWTTEPINGERLTPQQISTDILRSLKENAEIEMGEEVTDVVITVPAYFGERQCAATMEAAAAAGLNVLNILSEPHAAAVAYSIERSVCLTDKHVLVYDLGGGTFDVTLIKPVLPEGAEEHGISNLTLNTLCKDGNRELGGLDWDDAMIDLVAEKCIEQFDHDPRLDNRNLALLHDNCEKAKRALSKKSSETVVADLAGHMIEVTRSEFEESTSGLLLQTRMRLEQVLAEAAEQHGISLDDVDVLVCGGATRMPMVKAMLREVFGKDPLEYKNPQLLVSCGAAYVSHAMDPEATIPLPGPGGEANNEKVVTISPDSITDITCHAVGIQVIRRASDGEAKAANAMVLVKGTTFGEQREFVTETLFDGQTEVCIRLFEGESEDLDDCVHLMDFRIEGLPAERPRGRPIRTTLWFGSNGIITGTAVDVETAREIEIHYDRWSSLEAAAAQRSAPTPAPKSDPVAEVPQATEGPFDPDQNDGDEAIEVFGKEPLEELDASELELIEDDGETAPQEPQSADAPAPDKPAIAADTGLSTPIRIL
ncbi:MAG: molecular chaperone DnaK [Pseudohongiellaceae bacterium]|jgi:molecular chaperone DnaK